MGDTTLTPEASAEDAQMPVKVNGEAAPPAEAKNTDNEHMIPKSRLDEVNAAKKAAEERAQVLQAELDKQKTAQEKAEHDRLAKQGEFEQLYTQEQAKTADLTTRVTAQSERLEKLEGMFNAMLEKRKEGLPDHIKPLIDSMDSLDALAYLDEHAEKLMGGENGGARKQSAPPMHATDGTTTGKPVITLRKRVGL